MRVVELQHRFPCRGPHSIRGLWPGVRVPCALSVFQCTLLWHLL